MVILEWLHIHTTPNPVGLGHSKNQKKYVLITGNDILTPHIWYLTMKKVQDIVICGELQKSIVCVTSVWKSGYKTGKKP